MAVGARALVPAAALLLAACGGRESQSGPPLPVDTTPQKPAVADVSERVASGNTPAAADIAAIAALRAGFDPARNAADDLDTALVEAKRGNRRIVLELGDAPCAPCTALDAGIEGDAELRSLRNAGFVWVKVDRSGPDNAAFLASYPGGSDAPAPHLVVLDAEGALLHAQSGQELLRGEVPDEARIRAFLEAWAPPADAP